MHWLFFGALNVIGFSIAAIFQRLAMKKKDSDPVSSAIIFEFLLSLTSFIVALVFGFHLPPKEVAVPMAAIAVLYGFGSIFFFRSAKTTEASDISILGSMGTLVTVILSYFFLHERLSGTQMIGVFLILLSVVIINFSRHKLRLHTGAWQAILGAACFGSAVIFDAVILKSYDAISYLPVGSFCIAVLLLIVFPKTTAKLPTAIKSVDVNLIIYSVLYTFASLMFYIPMQLGAYVSQLSAVGRVSIILTVILSALFLKERSHIGKKIVGAILTTIGIFLIR